MIRSIIRIEFRYTYSFILLHVTYDDANDMRIHIAMIRALLTDVNQIKIDGTSYSNQIVNMLVELSRKAAKNESYRCNGSSV
jgi:hypothetical protein